MTDFNSVEEALNWMKEIKVLDDVEAEMTCPKCKREVNILIKNNKSTCSECGEEFIFNYSE